MGYRSSSARCSVRAERHRHHSCANPNPTLTQLSSGYVDVLKMFISAAKGGYELGLSIPALQLEITNSGTSTAGRPLMQEEIELRTVWISLVYITLELINHPMKLTDTDSKNDASATVPADIRKKFNTFCYDVVVNAKKTGFNLSTLKLEQVMKRSADDPAMEPMEEAVMSQCMRGEQ